MLGVQQLRAPVAVSVRLDERIVVCETLQTLIGPDAVVLESTIPEPDAPITLTSSYLGCPGDHTVASHACLSGRGRSRSWSRRIPGDLLPVSTAQERCLLDHLAILQQELADLGLTARITLAPRGAAVGDG